MSKAPSPIKAALRAQRAGGNTAYVPPALPQVSEFLESSSNSPTEVKLQECYDLRKLTGIVPRSREVLDDEGDRIRKYEIETGIGLDGRVRPPLEPWDCPVKGGVKLYWQVMFREVNVEDLQGEAARAAAWMREVQLVAVSESGQLEPLSDAHREDGRSYPGAPMSDRQAAIGRYLRGFAVGLVQAALANLSSGQTVRRFNSRGLSRIERGDGIAITAAMVCKEANAIRRKRRDLADYRWVSLSLVRELLKDLIRGGVVDELIGTRAVRRHRSWATLPRIIAKFTASLDRYGRPISPPLAAAA